MRHTQVCLIKALGFGSCTSKGSSQYFHAVLFPVGVISDSVPFCVSGVYFSQLNPQIHWEFPQRAKPFLTNLCYQHKRQSRGDSRFQHTCRTGLGQCLKKKNHLESLDSQLEMQSTGFCNYKTFRFHKKFTEAVLLGQWNSSSFDKLFFSFWGCHILLSLEATMMFFKFRVLSSIKKTPFFAEPDWAGYFVLTLLPGEHGWFHRPFFHILTCHIWKSTGINKSYKMNDGCQDLGRLSNRTEPSLLLLFTTPVLFLL